jgi:hypothetical protein
MLFTLPWASGWTRIEPRCRSDDFARGLGARIADPLWMIGRQWQVAELTGEDAGSPVDAAFSYRTSPIGSLRIGAQSMTLGAVPLEMLVEREAPPVDWRARVRAGQQLERFLVEELDDEAPDVIARFRHRFPVAAPASESTALIDAATHRFLQLMAGRATDGHAVLELVDRSTTPVGLPGGLALAADVIDGSRQALQRLVTWSANLVQRPVAGQRSAWQPRQLEYAFEMTQGADGGGQRLAAPHYRSGDLDWHAFDAQGNNLAPTGAAESASLVPTRVSFYGMPDARWWAFEDARIDFGKLDVARTDIAKMMLMEFALVYGNDWFILPLRLPIGSMTRIESLSVLDVFGVRTGIPRIEASGAAPLQAWRMFSVTSSSNDAADFLVIPPVVERQESDTLEEIRFLRDEGANMVFAVENTVLNGLGEPVPGYEAQRDRRNRADELDNQRDVAEMTALVEALQSLVSTAGAGTGSLTPEALADRVAAMQEQIAEISARLAARRAEEASSSVESSSGFPSYKLSTLVPDNWIPYLPVRVVGSDRAIALRQGRMLRNEATAAPEPITPMSRLLGDGTLESSEAWLNEECIPREGRQLKLTWQRARWIDGSTYLWLGRSVKLGRGEGSSGLRFDVF